MNVVSLGSAKCFTTIPPGSVYLNYRSSNNVKYIGITTTKKTRVVTFDVGSSTSIPCLQQASNSASVFSFTKTEMLLTSKISHISPNTSARCEPGDIYLYNENVYLVCQNACYDIAPGPVYLNVETGEIVLHLDLRDNPILISSWELVAKHAHESVVIATH